MLGQDLGPVVKTGVGRIGGQGIGQIVKGSQNPTGLIAGPYYSSVSLEKQYGQGKAVEFGEFSLIDTCRPSFSLL